MLQTFDDSESLPPDLTESVEDPAIQGSSVKESSVEELSGPAPFWRWLPGRPWVIAHRGFSGRAPENTLAAIQMAMDVGADMLEVDVTLSSDGHLMVIHDETLDRTAGGSGQVLGSTFKYIRSLDAGSWFHPRFKDQKVPTLEEVLELIQGKMPVNVEIKGEAVGDKIQGGIAEKVAETLDRFGMAEQTLVSSFEPRALDQLREIHPGIPKGSLYNRKVHKRRLPESITSEVDAQSFHVHRWYFRRAMEKEARRLDLPVLVYTVNHPLVMKRMIRRGVAGLFTDHPDRMIRLLQQRDRR